MESRGKKQPIRHEDGQSEIVRRFKERPFIFIGTVIVLIIVIVAFVFVPAIVPAAAGANIDLNFGSWNKAPINYVPGNYFAQVQKQMQDNYSRYMGSMDESNAAFYNQMIWRQSFEEAAVYTAMLDEMKQAGYTAPKDLVNREVAKQFQDDTGRFSRNKYRQLTNADRLALWRSVQDSLVVERYQEDVSGLRISSKETDFIASMASPQRSFDMVSFSLDSYPESEVVAYAEENSSLFRLTHLSKITITASEREAKKVLKDIQDGTLTFEDAARNHSKDYYAEQGGDLGLKMVFELTSDIPNAQDRDAVTALDAGEIGQIIKLDDGWVFFRAEAASYPADLTDRANIDKIRNYVLDSEQGRVENWLIAEADVFISLVQDNDFDTALFFRGLDKKSFGPLPINFGGSDLFPTLASFSISDLSSASAYDNFWRTAFFTPVNTPSSPFVVGRNVLVLYPREEITAEETALEEIKTNYNYWVSNNASQELRAYFLASPKLHDKFKETYSKIFNYGL